jgi:hypothetical protein
VATTTRSLIALTLGALVLAGRGAAGWPGGVGARGVDQVDPARLLRAPGDRGASSRRQVGTRLRRAAHRRDRAGDLALRLRLAAGIRPARANAESQTSYALPHRLEQLGVPHGCTWRLPSRRSRPACLARARGVAWPHRLGWRAACYSRRRPYLTPWYVIWALPLAAAEEDRTARLLALGFCAYLLPQTIPI